MKANAPPAMTVKEFTPGLQDTLNPEWALYVEESVREVFGLMLHTHVKRCAQGRPKPDITALIGLSGSLSLLLRICCSHDTAATFAARMISPDVIDTEEQILDALGEICNIVAGNFKARLHGLSDTCTLSIPTVISGQDYRVPSAGGGRELEILVECADGPLGVILHVND